jgi:hypothetical protein
VCSASADLLIRFVVGPGDGFRDLSAFVGGQSPGEHAE